MEEPEDPLGHRPGGNQEAPRPRPGQRSHQNSRTLRGRARRSGLPVAITDVGKTAGPLVAEAEEAGGEASERENREREEHLAQMAEEEARLGGEK